MDEYSKNRNFRIKNIDIIDGESELTKPTKYGYLNCMVEYDNGRFEQRPVYPEVYRLYKHKQNLINRGCDVSDLNKLIELAVEANDRLEWSNSIE